MSLIVEVSLDESDSGEIFINPDAFLPSMEQGEALQRIIDKLPAFERSLTEKIDEFFRTQKVNFFDGEIPFIEVPKEQLHAFLQPVLINPTVQNSSENRKRIEEFIEVYLECLGFSYDVKNNAYSMIQHF
jgi:hypothetical protein